MSIEVSMVIPTHNSRQTIGECLKSVSTLDYPPERFETIVVDDSDDDTEKIARKFPVRLLKHTGSAGAKRNCAAAVAKGRILVFIDSDCIVHPDWLKNLVRHFDLPNVAGVGGPNLTPKDDPPLAQCIGFALSSRFGSGGIRYAQVYRSKRFVDHNPTCNCAITKPAFEEVGGFDETLWPTEDAELDYRIRERGYKLVYDPEAIVWHRRKPSLKSLFTQIFRYGSNRVKASRRYPGLLKPVHILPSLAFLCGIVLVALTGFSLVPIWIIAGLTLAYLLIGLASMTSFGQGFRLKFIPMVLLAYATIHAAWGSGFLYGLARELVPSSRP